MDGVDDVEDPVTVQLLLGFPLVWEIGGENRVFSELFSQVLQRQLLEARHVDVLHL